MFGNSAVALADIEWDAPAPGTLAFLQFLLPLAVASISLALALRRGYRPPLVLVIATAVTATADLSAMRNGIWLAIAASMLAADAARSWVPSRPATPAFSRVLTVSAAVLAALATGSLALRGADAFETHAPLPAIAATAVYASVHPCARIMADTRSASALLWLQPGPRRARRLRRRARGVFAALAAGVDRFSSRPGRPVAGRRPGLPDPAGLEG